MAPEGGAHQSIATPLIGIAQDRLTSFEPAFADELAVILRWGFEHIQAPAKADDGGSVYLRLSTRALDQPQREMTAKLEGAILKGAYWLRRPGPNAHAAIAFTGAVAPGAIDATGLIGEDRRDVGLLFHLGGSSLRRLDPSARSPRAGASVSRQPCRRNHGQPSFLLRACHHHRWSSGDFGLARLRVRAQDAIARRSKLRSICRDGRSVPAFRHRCAWHRRSSASDSSWPAAPAFMGNLEWRPKKCEAVFR